MFMSLPIAAWISLVMTVATPPSQPKDAPWPGEAAPPASVAASSADSKAAEAQAVPEWLIGRPIDFDPFEQADPEKLELDHANQPPIVADEVLPGGQRRVYQTQRVRIPASELETLLKSGKSLP